MATSTISSSTPLTGLPQRGLAGRALHSSAARCISPLAIVVLWQALSSAGILAPKTLAAPTEIVATAWDLTVSGDLPNALLVSLRRALLGLVAGVAAAVALGSIAGLSRPGDALVDPPMQMIARCRCSGSCRCSSCGSGSARPRRSRSSRSAS